MKTKIGIGVFLLVGLSIVTMAGCSVASTPSSHSSATQSAGSLSRVKYYNSTKAMADDSAVIVIGTPQSETVAADIDGILDFTLTSFVVDKVVKGHQTVKVHDVIIVRQIGARPGSETNAETPQVALVPLLDIGTRYLLYLTPSGLPGDLASQYYVTGADAGIYVASTAHGLGGFNRANHDADILPDSLNENDAQG